MKQILFSLVLVALGFSAMAQKNDTPTVFHSRYDYVMYQTEHPASMAFMTFSNSRDDEFKMKLDSIVGADDFDWTHWKNLYSYPNADESVMIETRYQLVNQEWSPLTQSICQYGLNEGMKDVILSLQWNENQWDSLSRVTYHYNTIAGAVHMTEFVTETYSEEGWTPSNRSLYSYDASGNPTLLLICYGIDTEGNWIENSKYDYTYNEDGNLLTQLYSTIRNGNWRESTMDSLAYDEQHQCVNIFGKRKGGMGPGSNAWRDSYRYDLTYAEGRVATETMYAAGGWFGGGEMTLDAITEYTYDVNGNAVRKTASIYNGEEWVVRDIYENSFDLQVNAERIVGLAPAWESVATSSFVNALGVIYPLANQWNSCSITSANLDTWFNLYYSGFESIGEQQVPELLWTTQSGSLTLQTSEPVNITLYDILGHSVLSRENLVNETFSLKPGAYILSVNGKSLKVLVN